MLQNSTENTYVGAKVKKTNLQFQLDSRINNYLETPPKNVMFIIVIIF